MSTSIKMLGEVAVAREVFLLYLELCRSTTSIIHIVSSIGWWANIQPMIWIGRISISHMKISFLLISRVLRMRIHSFSLESFPNHLTLYQFLSPFKVTQRSYNFRICRNGIFLQINQLWSSIALNPRSTVLLIGGIIEGTLSCASKCIISCLIHLRFIYNLNNIPRTYYSTFRLNKQQYEWILLSRHLECRLFIIFRMQVQQNQQILLLFQKDHQSLRKKPQIIYLKDFLVCKNS